LGYLYAKSFLKEEPRAIKTTFDEKRLNQNMSPLAKGHPRYSGELNDNPSQEIEIRIGANLPAPAVIIGLAEIIDLICITKWAVLGRGNLRCRG
jgi:hypothetical protein